MTLAEAARCLCKRVLTHKMSLGTMIIFFFKVLTNLFVLFPDYKYVFF